MNIVGKSGYEGSPAIASTCGTDNGPTGVGTGVFKTAWLFFACPHRHSGEGDNHRSTLKTAGINNCVGIRRMINYRREQG